MTLAGLERAAVALEWVRTGVSTLTSRGTWCEYTIDVALQGGIRWGFELRVGGQRVPGGFSLTLADAQAQAERIEARR